MAGGAGGDRRGCDFRRNCVLARAGVLHDARERVAAESRCGSRRGPIEPVLCRRASNSVGAPAVFLDAQIFHGHLFIAGPAGLAELRRRLRARVARYRVGAELPPAPLTSLAVGTGGRFARGRSCGSAPRAKGWSRSTAAGSGRFARRTRGFGKSPRCCRSRPAAF